MTTNNFNEKDNSGRRLERLRLFSIAGLLLSLVAVTVILNLGIRKTHRGLLILQQTEQATADSAELIASPFSTIHRADLKSQSELFRGSDLFYVTEVNVEHNSIVDADSIKLDPAYNNNVLSFTSPGAIDQSQPIPATFRLKTNSKKIYPAVVVVAVFLLLLLAAPSYQRLPAQHLLKSKNVPAAFATACMLAVLLALVVFNVTKPGWTYGDSHQFLSTTVQGKMTWIAVYPELGRFYPLGLLDNNLLIPFGNSPLAYQVERSILLCILVASMFVLTWRMSNLTFASLATLLFLTTPDLYRVYSESIFPEASLLVYLTLFFLFYHRATNSKGTLKTQTLAAIAACLCAAAATYCKEPVFGLLMIFSCIQMLGFKKQSAPALAIHGFVVVNAIVFLSLYWLWCSGGQNYAAIRTEGSNATIFSIFLRNFSSPMSIMTIVVAGFRMWRLVIGRDREFLFSDGILLAGIGYGVAFCLLKLEANYYMVPSHACWAIAMAGYLKQTEVNLTSLERRLFPRPDSALLVKCLACAAVAVVLFQARGTRISVADLNSKRQDCKNLSQIFGQLEHEGYSLFLLSLIHI